MAENCLIKLRRPQLCYLFSNQKPSAMLSVFILSSANIATQWVGWLFSVIACIMWVYFGYKDRDWPRTLMEFMYLIFSMRAMYNWLVI